MNFYIEAMYQFFLQKYFFDEKIFFFVKEKNIFEKSKISMKNEKIPSVEMRFFIEIFDFPKSQIFQNEQIVSPLIPALSLTHSSRQTHHQQ